MPETQQLGPSDGSILVKVFRDGLAKKVGHDLVMELTQWDITITRDGDWESARISASGNVNSFEVREGVGGVKALSAGDRDDIVKNIGKKVLDTKKHQQIGFVSTAIKPAGESHGTVTGDLTIEGQTRPVDVDVTMAGGRAKATFTIVQSKWGIKPFSAMMGALKVRDAVEVEIDVAVGS
jgi:polyisoprenoid-binding protein YceI